MALETIGKNINAKYNMNTYCEHPLVGQVAQLTVLNAAWDGARSQTTQAATLVENAGSVMASAEELAKVGQRIAMETSDQVTQGEPMFN